jgi:hypothetical protein
VQPVQQQVLQVLQQAQALLQQVQHRQVHQPLLLQLQQHPRLRLRHHQQQVLHLLLRAQLLLQRLTTHLMTAILALKHLLLA